MIFWVISNGQGKFRQRSQWQDRFVVFDDLPQAGRRVKPRVRTIKAECFESVNAFLNEARFISKKSLDVYSRLIWTLRNLVQKALPLKNK